MPRIVRAVLAAFLPLLPLLFSEDGGTSHDWTSRKVPDPRRTQPPPASVQSVRSDHHLARDLNHSLTPEWLVEAVTTPVDDKLPVLEVLDAIRSRLILKLSLSPVRLSVGLFAVSLLVFVPLVIRLFKSRLSPQTIDATRTAEVDTSINSTLGDGGNADLHGAKRFLAESDLSSPPIPLLSRPTCPLANAPDKIGTGTEIQAAIPSLRDTPGNSSMNESPTSFSPPSLNIGHIFASLARSRVAPAQSESCESLKDIDVRDMSRPSPPRPYWSLDRACEDSLYSHSDPSTCHTAPSSPQPSSDQEQLDYVGPGDDHLNYISDVDREREAVGRERVLSDITERTEPDSDIEAPGTPRARWFSGIHRRLASLDTRSGLSLGAETALVNLSAASSPELPHEPSSATLRPSATVSAPRLAELQLPSRDTHSSLGLAQLDVPDVPSDVDVDGPRDEGDEESERQSLSSVCWNVLNFPSDRVGVSEAYQTVHEHQSDGARSSIFDSSSWNLDDEDDASTTIMLDEVRVELHTASDWSLVGSPSASTMDEANTNGDGDIGSETHSSSRAGTEWNVTEVPERGPPPTLSPTPEPRIASIALEAEVDDISTRLEVDRVSPEADDEDIPPKPDAEDVSPDTDVKVLHTFTQRTPERPEPPQELLESPEPPGPSLELLGLSPELAEPSLETPETTFEISPDTPVLHIQSPLSERTPELSESTQQLPESTSELLVGHISYMPTVSPLTTTKATTDDVQSPELPHDSAHISFPSTVHLISSSTTATTGHVRSSTIVRTFGTRSRRPTRAVVARSGFAGQQVSLTAEGMDFVAEQVSAVGGADQKRVESITMAAVHVHGECRGPARGKYEVIRERRTQAEPVPARLPVNIIDGTQNPPLDSTVQIRRNFYEVSRSRNRRDSNVSNNVLLERAPTTTPTSTTTAVRQRSDREAPEEAPRNMWQTIDTKEGSLPHTTPFSYASVAATPPPRQRTVSERTAATSPMPRIAQLRRCASINSSISLHARQQSSEFPVGSTCASFGPSTVADQASTRAFLVNAKGKGRVKYPTTQQEEGTKTAHELQSANGDYPADPKGKGHDDAFLTVDPEDVKASLAAGSSAFSRLSQAASHGGSKFLTSIGTRINMRQLATKAHASAKKTGMISSFPSGRHLGGSVASESGSGSGASAGTAVPRPSASHSATDFSEGSVELASPLRGLVARVQLGKTEPPSAVEIDSVSLVENSSSTLLLPAERALASGRVTSDGVDEGVSLEVTTGQHVPPTPTPQARVFMRPTNDKAAHALSSQSKSPLRSRSRVSTAPLMLMASFPSALGLDSVELTACRLKAESSSGEDDTIVWEPSGRPHPCHFDRTQDTNLAIHEDEQDDIFASHRRASSDRIGGGQVLTRPISGATRRARVSFTGGRFDPLPPHVVVQ